MTTFIVSQAATKLQFVKSKVAAEEDLSEISYATPFIIFCTSQSLQVLKSLLCIHYCICKDLEELSRQFHSKDDKMVTYPCDGIFYFQE